MKRGYCRGTRITRMKRGYRNGKDEGKGNGNGKGNAN
jgi:hypothetical protein